MVHEVDSSKAPKLPGKRQIIQIAATRDEDGNAILFALANDGTLWEHVWKCIGNNAWEPAWQEMKEIPQPGA